MKRRLKDFLKRAMVPVHRLGLRAGVAVTPAHFYTAEPNIVELERTRAQWMRPLSMAGIEVALDRQASELRAFCTPFRDEYAAGSTFRSAMEDGYGPGYGLVEAQVLHAVVRHLRPRRIVEVGSGVSTRCAFEAAVLTARQGGPTCEITCIEPYPSDRLRALQGAAGPVSVSVVDLPVQAAPVEPFTRLEAGDILFIDSSHVVKAGSDVTFILLEILPRVPKGVLVHFHDIYLPFDYPHETAALAAFLAFNSKFEILFSLSHLHYERPDVLRELFPDYVRQPDDHGLRVRGDVGRAGHFPSSTWLRVTA